ncbi:MAG: baseplate protein [Azospirillum brasilense]|nr:MAG: baseplate protein [Azospirillum brasilense]
MALQLSGNTELVNYQTAEAQARLAQRLDTRPGSMIRAIFEATAGVGVWLQYVAMQVLAATRLGSSNGEDVDSFVADYGLERLAAIPSKGQETFYRSTPSNAAVVPVGAIVRTEGGVQFRVSTDETHALWGSSIGAAGGYTLPVGMASASLPIVALVGGTAGNVEAGTVSLLSTGISGIDGVINPLAMGEGEDQESDEALKARFALHIQGLSKATKEAVEAAVAGAQQGLSWHIDVNQDETGSWRPGHFVVTIDDGSGATPPETVAAVYAAVDEVKALAETFAVHAATVVPVDVAVTLVLKPSTVDTAIRLQVRDAIATLLAECGIGDPVSASAIAAACHAVSPSVLRVSQTLINGIPHGDFITAPTQVVRAGIVTVS